MGRAGTASGWKADAAARSPVYRSFLALVPIHTENIQWRGRNGWAIYTWNTTIRRSHLELQDSKIWLHRLLNSSYFCPDQEPQPSSQKNQCMTWMGVGSGLRQFPSYYSLYPKFNNAKLNLKSIEFSERKGQSCIPWNGYFRLKLLLGGRSPPFPGAKQKSIIHSNTSFKSWRQMESECSRQCGTNELWSQDVGCSADRGKSGLMSLAENTFWKGGEGQH